MATSTKNKPAPKDAKALARSEAAKKAAETRKKNKLAKEAEAKAEASKQEQIELKQEVTAAKTVKICDVICEVLQQVRPGTEKQERPEGYTYKECLDIVLERVRPTNPNAQTSLDCLRWYATKLRSEGIVLPYRPRNAPVKKDVLA